MSIYTSPTVFLDLKHCSRSWQQPEPPDRWNHNQSWERAGDIYRDGMTTGRDYYFTYVR